MDAAEATGRAAPPASPSSSARWRPASASAASRPPRASQIPDVLVVTKADLGQVATRARRDLHAALRSLGERSTKVAAVSSIHPVQGIDDLIAALDAHRADLDLAAARTAARRLGTLAERAGVL